MTLRMAALAAFIAVFPLSVDAPPDSSGRHGETRVAAVAGTAQYGIVTRGCNDEVIDVVDRELRGGALEIEHETTAGVVIGVRGGQVRESQDTRIERELYGNTYVTYPGFAQTNRYVNPYVAFEREPIGIGIGWLRADHRFASGGEGRTRYDVSGHIRFGSRDSASLAIRFMEELPLQQMGNVSIEVTLDPVPRLELGPTLGFMGPFDGVVLGLRSRFWITPEAALHVRACFGGVQQYGLAAGVAARFPGRR